jgi:tRNA (adenine22-N1)-methyltransferase
LIFVLKKATFESPFLFCDPARAFSIVKLGKRLKQLESMVTASYDHIWDCCCDHGLLGAALLARQAAPTIHFVDLVPELMFQLENKLARFFPENSTLNFRSQWHVHCLNVTELPLQEFKGKHLVIIAGVGGDLVAEFIRAIYQNNSDAEVDFLLCPVHHQFTLRQQLIQCGFGLKNEVLLVENKRFYEVLLVSSKKLDVSEAVSPVGRLLWQNDTAEQLTIAQSYLSKTLAHYKRMRQQPSSKVHPTVKSGVKVQAIIDAYSAVVIAQA